MKCHCCKRCSSSHSSPLWSLIKRGLERPAGSADEAVSRLVHGTGTIKRIGFDQGLFRGVPGRLQAMTLLRVSSLSLRVIFLLMPAHMSCLLNIDADLTRRTISLTAVKERKGHWIGAGLLISEDRMRIPPRPSVEPGSLVGSPCVMIIWRGTCLGLIPTVQGRRHAAVGIGAGDVKSEVGDPAWTGGQVSDDNHAFLCHRGKHRCLDILRRHVLSIQRRSSLAKTPRRPLAVAVFRANCCHTIDRFRRGRR